MSMDNEADLSAANEDDFDISADLAAAFDAAEEPAETSADVPEETAAETAERVRDEKGRFAPKATEVAATETQPTPTVEAKADVAAPVDPVPVAGELRAPPGWSPAAKVAFANAPPEIQQAVAKREQEVNAGFAKLAEYKPIERYAEMARQSGTTLDKALDNYIGIENQLRSDFPSAIETLCQRSGIHPVALANHILARNGGSPDQYGDTGATQANQKAQVDLSPVMQKISALESYIAQQQNQGVQSEIERFASDPKHTFFDNVKADMGRLINSGYATDLSDAYDKACWANAEIRGLLIKQQSVTAAPSAKAAAANQARAASKSITGSPIPNASVKGPQSSLEDEIRQLMDSSV
jgi:hypothetical protein